MKAVAHHLHLHHLLQTMTPAPAKAMTLLQRRRLLLPRPQRRPSKQRRMLQPRRPLPKRRLLLKRRPPLKRRLLPKRRRRLLQQQRLRMLKRKILPPLEKSWRLSTTWLKMLLLTKRALRDPLSPVTYPTPLPPSYFPRFTHVTLVFHPLCFLLMSDRTVYPLKC